MGRLGTRSLRFGVPGESLVPIRSLIGPLIIAVAVWAAAGELTLNAAVASAARLAAPAHPAWLLIGLAGGLALKGIRRSPWLASPALLTVLPWIPVPWPPAALIWTGALAWVPISAAAMCALMAGAETPRVPRPHASPARQAVAAGLLSLLAGGMVWASVHERLPGGDEPHYLVIAQSLLKDGDLRIENNHANRDYAEYWGGDLAPHFIQRGQDGEIYSIHAPGVSVLVAPLFAVFGLAGAQATILLLMALTGAFVWLAGWYATGRSGPAWFAWAAVSGSVTLLVQSVTIFPDGPGAAVVAAAAVVWLRLRRGDTVSGPLLVALSASLAALPFLHTRFVVLAAGLGLAVVALLWRTAEKSGKGHRVATFLAVPAVGALLWFGYFDVIYGTPNPVIPYGSGNENRLAYAPGGVAGLLFDQQFGLFASCPVLMLAFVGWAQRGGEGSGRRLWPLALVAVTYLAVVSTYWMWWAGVPGTPARLATSVLPLMAAPVAVVWSGGHRTRRTIAASLLAVSLAMSVMMLGTRSGDLAWSDRNGHAAWLVALGSVADLPRAWPSFFWRLVGGDVSSQWPFAWHVVLWIACFAGVLVVVRASARLGTSAMDRQVAIAGWALPVALMIAAQAAWWLNDVSGVRPASSQLAWLREVAAGARGVQLTPGGVSRLDAGAAPVRITVPRTDLPGDAAASWAALTGVPAGHYDLRLTVPRPAGGVLAIRTGVGGEPLRELRLPRQSVHTVPIDLPVGVADLRLVPDDTLAAAEGELVLMPRTLVPGHYVGAHSRIHLGETDVYVLGDTAFVEGRALWVRGAQTAQLVLVPTDGSERQVALRLSNGPHENPVVVTIAGQSRRLDLVPSAVTVVTVTLAPGAPLAVSVTSPSGFRPSDDGQSLDGRYLGVRVEFDDAGGDPPPEGVQ
jgi:hypothetical protein